MTSSDPNTVFPSRVGVGPRASHVLDPRPIISRDFPNPGDDLQLQLYDMCYQGKMFIIFLSILLGDDQALDEGMTVNKRVKRGDGTDHETMQPHSRELANLTTTLWLPENLRKRGGALGYKTRNDFLQSMKMVFMEVMEFGARATDVARAFARIDFDLVDRSLLHLDDLRSTLQGIVKDMQTKLPLIDPLLPDIEPSNGIVPGASSILEPQPPRVGSNAGDPVLQLRTLCYDSKQFYIFISILLGEDQPPDEGATVHDSGGVLSVTDHDSPQPHGGQVVAPTATAWLPEYLKKRDAIPDYNSEQCSKLLIGLFEEVMKFGARATDVAKAFARMDIEFVEYLLARPDELRSTFRRLDNIAEDQDTRKLIQMFITPDLETGPNTGIDLDALPE